MRICIYIRRIFQNLPSKKKTVNVVRNKVKTELTESSNSQELGG